MRRGQSYFSNKPIAENRLGSALIAIFAEHSTRLPCGTIIFRSHDRAASRA
jgi:hypothetical protein